MYAIKKNENWAQASNNAVQSHIEQVTGKQHPIRTIQLWSDKELARYDVAKYTIKKPELKEYQEYSNPTFNVVDGQLRLTYTAKNISLDAAKAQAKAKVAAKRWEVEVGGTMVPMDFGDSDQGIVNVPMQTSRETRANYIYAMLQAQADPTFTVTWKAIDESFVTMTAPIIQQVTVMVGAHVQASYLREEALYAEIDAAASVTALRAIDLDAGWQITSIAAE